MPMHLLECRADERLVIIDSNNHEIIITVQADNQIGIEVPDGVSVRKEESVLEEIN